MPTNKMLIDASHQEETRVVVVRDNEIEEFDFEAAARKLLKGSIFLAKVTRVEPSLQAAFVDYGGNRHGFLAFNEIHPDYYQIPHADRLALLAEEEAAQLEAAQRQDAETDGDDEADGERSRPRRTRRRRTSARSRSERDDDGDDQPYLDPDDSTDIDIEVDFDDDVETIDVTSFLPDEEDVPAGPESAHDDDTTREASAVEIAAGESRVDEDREADGGGSDAGEPDETSKRGRSQTKAVEVARDDTISVEVEPAPLEGFDAGAEQAIELQPDPDSPEGPLETESASGSDHESAELDASSDAPAPAEAVVDSGDDAAGDEPSADEDEADEADEADGVEETVVARRSRRGRRYTGRRGRRGRNRSDEEADNDNADEEVEDDFRPRRRRARSYKIQEVIKRRQIILVQVVKEERGTKGAALTTYLSLAGRYTVLMPNTARGGGISRKITNAQDRKRLKAIAQELDVPEGMGLIIRTAGAARTKQEIKRDFEYLLRLWESVRDLTLRSTAPALVYEEGDLIKRSIRDLYAKDIDEIVVSGDEAFREAKDFMRMLMPSHAKNVIKHEGRNSLFADFRIEQRLADMFSPIVSLRSGGYLVINQTEALVAIDINSGKATREFSIEETALKTNLEAAEEIARQLKLRDLAGLVVVDFIDMDEKRNNRTVERRIKECLKRDRARIQVGRISHFGLLEMSRQRLRTGVLEGSTTTCPHCQGSGMIRSVESVALAVLRGIEDTLMSQSGTLVVRAPSEVAFFLLNQKRSFVTNLEAIYASEVRIVGSAKTQGANFEIERLSSERRATAQDTRSQRPAISMDAGFETRDDQATDDDGDSDSDARDEGSQKDKGRRRRHRSRGTDQVDSAPSDSDEGEDERNSEDARSRESDGDGDGDGDDLSSRGRRQRRRGRRGGRRGGGRDRTGDSVDYSQPGALQPDIFGFEEGGYRGQAAAASVAALRIKSASTSSQSGEPNSERRRDRPAEGAAEPKFNDSKTIAAKDEAEVQDAAESEAAVSIVTQAETSIREAPTQNGAASADLDDRQPTGATPTEETVTLPKWKARSLKASEPVVRRVTVSANSDAPISHDDAGEGSGDESTRRKGWWQRTFGS